MIVAFESYDGAKVLIKNRLHFIEPEVTKWLSKLSFCLRLAIKALKIVFETEKQFQKHAKF